MKNIIDNKENLKKLIKLFNDNGYEIYLVGGVVRDTLLGRDVNDIDFTTSASPSEMIEMLGKIYKLNLNGLKHGTVGVITGGAMYEITTFRTEAGYLDNRHPDYVKFVRNIYEDLARRDFTINALAVSPNNFDEIIDYFNGLKDLENKIIRTVLKPKKRFKEDALRILRGLRFASSLGFKIERKTKKAIFKYYKHLASISKERIRDELKGMVCGENFYEVFKEYKRVFDFLFETRFNKDALAIIKEKITLLDNSLERITLIFNFVKDPLKVTKDLRFSNIETSNIINGLSIINVDINTNKDMRLLLNKYHPNEVYNGIRVKGALEGDSNKYISQFINNKDKPNRIKDLDINGNDLMKLDIYKRNIGFVLKEIMNSVISEEVDNNKEDLIKKALVIKEKLIYKRGKI